ncbi:MAG TPA: ATP-binding protein [Acidimicrobiales bacterium]|nr:ATP-binding protein [Acidimicrobiales bacterium]
MRSEDRSAATGPLADRRGDELVATRSFADDTTSAAEARHFVIATLTRWGCERLVDDAQLIVSELVTNAVLHAHSPAHLDVRLVRGHLRLEVTDGGGGTPRQQPWDPHRIGGRGLMIVSRLATRWGVDHEGGRKSVWAELAT